MRDRSFLLIALVVLVALSLVTAVPAVPAADASMVAPESDGANTREPFSPQHLWEMERISSPVASPDGTRIVFVLRTTDFEDNRGRTDLWTVSIDGTGLRRMTWDSAADHSPAWTPDGSAILFLSSRSGSSQIWSLPVAGGEPRQVTDLALDVQGFLQSPNGQRIAIALEVFPDCDTVTCTVDRLAERVASKVTAIAYDQLFVRHWDTWKDGRRVHLHVIPAAGGDPVDIMRGMDADAPTKPFGGMEEVAWTPDGEGLVFTARDVGPSEAWSTDFDLYVAPVDGAAAPRCLTESNDAWDSAPAFSPDGSTLAYVAMERPGFEADRFRVILRPWPDGPTRVLTADWDRSVGGVTWSADGSTLYAAVGDVGEVKLYAIDVETGTTPRMLVDGGHVRSPQPAGGRILFGRDDLRSPVELFTIAPDGSDLRRVTDVNGERLAGIVMGEPEQFSFRGWNDEEVHGWIVKPANFDPEKRYPIAFLIHGGPQGSFGNDFHYRWNPQTYAGRGYAAVMIDFHGSTGYGQAFTDSISGDWGGKPLVDLQTGLAAALERYPFLDGDRACALGASYGGYMVNWIAGQWPDRFRCLVNHDGVFDTFAMYFETEELWFPEWENRGTPWDSAASYEVYNPAKYVDRWRTPILVVQGSLDFRVPETQGIGAFTAAQRRGVPSRFLRFPDENHWVLSPANGLRWHEEVLGWLDRWTTTGGKP